MTCISGPPCRPGKTAEFIFLAISSSLVRIMPPRGPRSDLCVVVVDDMRMRHRRGMHAAGDQAGEMRHVDHEIGADLVGDLAETREIPEARIGRAAGDDQLRAVLARPRRHRVHVESWSSLRTPVMRRLEPFAGHVHRRAVRQVAAGGEVEAHESVAGLQQRQEHRLVHLAAGVRLNVGEAGSRTAFSPARWRASRRRRRTRSRHNSAGPDSPRRICWS